MKQLCTLALLACSFAASAQRDRYQSEEHGFKVTTFAAPLFPSRTNLLEPVEGKTSFRGYAFGLGGLIPRKTDRFYWQAGLRLTNFEETFDSGKITWNTQDSLALDTLPSRVRQIDDYFFLDAAAGVRFFLNPGKRLKFYLHPSFGLDIRLSGKRFETTLYGNGSVKQVSSDETGAPVKKVNLAAFAGAGAEWQLHPVAALYVEPHFFTHLLPTFGEKSRLRGFGVSGGFVFKL